MAKSFNTLRDEMSPERQKKIKANAEKLLEAMKLNELRKTQRLTQEKLAEKLDTKQASLSRLESQSDMYISTLQRYIEAMGGELDLIARFPSGDISISQFTQKSHKASRQN